MYADVYIPDPPAGINEEAADFWRYVHEATPLSDHERSVLMRLCQTYTLVDEMREELRREGNYTVPGTKGIQVAHPLLCEIRLQLGLADALYKTLRLHDIIGESAVGKGSVPADTNVVDMIARAQSRKAN